MDLTGTQQKTLSAVTCRSWIVPVVRNLIQTLGTRLQARGPFLSPRVLTTTVSGSSCFSEASVAVSSRSKFLINMDRN